MAGVRLEVLVEPFRENDPGPHVSAAIDALASAGLEPDMGPFATTAEGTIEGITAAVADLLTAAFTNGATSVQLRVDRLDE